MNSVFFFLWPSWNSIWWLAQCLHHTEEKQDWDQCQSSESSLQRMHDIYKYRSTAFFLCLLQKSSSSLIIVNERIYKQGSLGGTSLVPYPWCTEQPVITLRPHSFLNAKAWGRGLEREEVEVFNFKMVCFNRGGLCWVTLTCQCCNLDLHHTTYGSAPRAQL